jgi:hypothetical protein
MKTTLLACASLAFLATGSAVAQQVVVINGQKVVVQPNNPNGKPDDVMIPNIPPPPPLVGGSDLCATPDVVVGIGTFGYNTTAATTGTEGQTESLCLNVGSTAIYKDVWFTWTSPFTGTARVEVCTFTTLDTKIGIYTGTACPTSSAIACNDDSCGLQSSLTFAATTGSSYVFQIGAYSAAAAGVTASFAVSQDIPPANDTCAAALTVVGNGPFPFDTRFATTGVEGQAEVLCGAGAAAAIRFDQWFTWNATFTGTAAATTCGGTTGNTKIAVYAGLGCPVAASIACNDTSCGNQAAATFACTLGQDYTIQMGNNDTATVGSNGTFRFENASPPTNDDCSTPIVLANNGTFPFNTTYASTSSQGQTEALCLNVGQTGIGFDLWYTYTPSESGTVTVTTCGGTVGSTSNDSKIAIYNGAGCPVAGAIACNDDAACTASGVNSTLTFPAVCGSTYTIQIGRYPPAGAVVGTFTISVAGGVPCISGVGFCFGDGTGTACPCANNGAIGNGCANSVIATGANLSSSGNSSVSADTVVLTGTGMPNSSALYFQGTAQASAGAGTVFGDGKRCAAGSVIRLGTKSNVAGTSTYPAVGDQPVSVKGLVPVAGATRDYQVWYRNAAAFCTVSTFNLSNGWEIVWLP